MLKERGDEVLIQPADQHTHNPATELTNNDLTDNDAQPPNVWPTGGDRRSMSPL